MHARTHTKVAAFENARDVRWDMKHQTYATNLFHVGLEPHRNDGSSKTDTGITNVPDLLPKMLNQCIIDESVPI